MFGSQGFATINLQAFLQGNAAERTAIAKQVDAQCQDTGFLVVTHHQVPNDTLQQAWVAARQFFDLPYEQKYLSMSPDKDCPRGYFPQGSEALAQSLGLETPVDQKESFSSGPLQPPQNTNSISSADLEFHYGTNLWPMQPLGFQTIWRQYYQAMEQLGAQLLQLFAAALALPGDYFAPFHTHHMSALRAINYPSLSRSQAKLQIGAGEHSDYGSLTILKPDPAVAGLEIKLPSGRWVTAPQISDGFIINIGDMFARWTNERWVSTRHRVLVPQIDGEQMSPRRQSIAFFYNTNFDAKIDCLNTCSSPSTPAKYPAVCAGDYLMQRFLAAKSDLG